MSGVVAVYGGGGAKAAAHLGAERALREKGLAPVGYVGCSLGAVVAAALALGWGPAAVEERMVELGRRRIAVVDPLIFLLGVKRRSLLKPTCALPLYFPPVLIGGRRYVDGGIRSVLPIESALLYSPDRVVAVDVGPGFDEAPATSGATLPALIEIAAPGRVVDQQLGDSLVRAVAEARRRRGGIVDAGRQRRAAGKSAASR